MLCALLLSAAAMAGIPSGYYSNANGKYGAALKTALYNIINSHTAIGYKAVWTAYQTTDLRSDGYIWDIYSNTTNYTYSTDQAGSSGYKAEGDCYNREHVFCQSWFEDCSSQSTMECDVHHIFPSDGYVNGKRGNNPFGPVGSTTYTSNNSFSKLGTCSLSSYSGTVFEPNDEYKGDIARAIFYFVTCYQNEMSSASSDMSSQDTYPSLTDWAKEMLLEWAANDPVSDKETARNDAIYALQGNRNPYIDYPGLEQYVWGDLKTTAVDLDNYTSPTGTSTGGSDDDDDDDEKGSSTTGSGVVYKKVTDASTLAAGDTLVIVYESSPVAMSTTQNTNNRGNVSVTLNSSESTVTINSTTQKILLEGTSGAWYLHAINGDDTGYLATSTSTSSNQLVTNSSTSDYGKCSIAISSGNATITFAGKTSRNVLQYNTGNSIFSCYNSSTQQAVQLYRATTSSTSTDTGGDTPTETDPTVVSSDAYYKVYDATTLTAGDTIIFVNEDALQAMSTTQNTNNRGQAEVTISDDICTPTTNVQRFLLEAAGDDSWYFHAINGDNQGYIYAASSSKNYLHTASATSDNCAASISISSSGDATVTFLGEYTRNLLQYNKNSSIFSCYSSSQQAVQIYRRAAANSISVTISDIQYATLYYGTLNLQVPTGVVAWAGKAADGYFAATHTYNEGDIIPAGTAVVLQGNAATYEFPISTASGTAPTENMLFGSDVEATTTYTSDDARFYGLSYDENNTAGFYWMAANGAAFTLPAHKAYLVVPQTDADTRILFNGPATGVEQVTGHKSQVTSIFDLQGRKLQRLQKGVNIVNGKKVLVK